MSRCTIFTALFFLSSLCSLCLCGEKTEPHRSPVDVALLPDGRLALTANHTADSLSLVDLSAGKVLSELPCGRKPVAVACSPDGRHAAVSNLWSASLSLFDIDGARIKSAGVLSLGIQTRGLVFAAKGRLYAALAGEDAVVAIDLASRKITQRWPAPREPRHLALSPDGHFLAAASSRSAQVRLWELTTGKLVWTRTIGDAFNLRSLAFAPDGRAVICAHAIKRSFPVSRENIDKGWVTDSRLTRLPVDARAVPPLEQIALDTHGQAVGDPHGVAFDPAGRISLSPPEARRKCWCSRRRRCRGPAATPATSSTKVWRTTTANCVVCRWRAGHSP